jgi:hypothetical protein
MHSESAIDLIVQVKRLRAAVDAAACDKARTCTALQERADSAEAAAAEAAVSLKATSSRCAALQARLQSAEATLAAVGADETLRGVAGTRACLVRHLSHSGHLCDAAAPLHAAAGNAAL